MIDSECFIDSSVWLGYLIGNMPKAKEIIESKEIILLTSIISIHEIYKTISKIGKKPEEAIKFIEENSTIIGIDKMTAINSAENCEKYSLHTIDSLIYTSAQENKATFITADNDFRNTPNTKIIPAR
jgi:predicted nucleic acid-binding protein